MSESKIEGIETISNRFHHMYSALKKKPYDPLDHRKTDFEADFFEFRRQISEIQVCPVLAYLCMICLFEPQVTHTNHYTLFLNQTVSVNEVR